MSRLLDFGWAVSFCHRSEETRAGKGSHTPIFSLLAFLVQGRNWWERTWTRLSLYESNYFLCSMSLSKPQMLFHVIQHWNRAPCLSYSKISWYSCHLPTEKILGNITVRWSLMVSHHITWSWRLKWKNFMFFSLDEAKTQTKTTKTKKGKRKSAPTNNPE